MAGLLCGIALKHAGHTVQILEQYGNDRDSHQSGLGLGPDGHDFMKRHDRHEQPFSYMVSGLTILGRDGTVRHFPTGRRDLTSWDALYYRLRSLYDGYPSTYYPTTPAACDTDGAVTYSTYKQVLNIVPIDGRVGIDIWDSRSETSEFIKADLVVSADGPNSRVRLTYQPQIRRKYAGYVIWHGLVAETEITPEALNMIGASVVTHRIKKEHLVLYLIPGLSGSLSPGERFVNFAWYTNESPEELEEIMVDNADGHRHRFFVPKGHVRDSVWKARLLRTEELELPEPFKEVASKIHEPFIQMISDYCPSRAAFEDGKVLIIGDALSQFRPHAALSVAQAAAHATAVEDYVSGKISLQDWETRVLRQSYLGWSLNVWWGNYYQKGPVRALPAALRYWVYSGFYRFISWWRK